MSVFSLIVKGKKFVFKGPELILNTLELQRGTEDFPVANDNNRLLNRSIVALILIVGFFELLFLVAIHRCQVRRDLAIRQRRPGRAFPHEVVGRGALVVLPVIKLLLVVLVSRCLAYFLNFDLEVGW